MDGNNIDHNNSVINAIKKVIECIALISAITYYLGFLFTEGLTGAFNNSGNLYAVISRGFLGFIPFSNQLYFMNGIAYIIKLIPFSVISFCVWCFAINMIKKFINYFLSVKLIIKIKNRILNVKLIIIIIKKIKNKLQYYNLSNRDIFFSIYLIFLIKLSIYLNIYFINNKSPFYSFIFMCTFIIFIFEIIRCSIIIKVDTKNIKSIIINKFLKYIVKISCMVSIFFLISYVTYDYGIQSMSQYLDDTLKGTDSFQYARIYMDNSETISCFFLDNNNDYFIGYTVNPNNIITIPKDSIKKIDIYTSNKPMDKTKYDIKDDYKYSNSVKSLESLVNNFYNYRIKNPNPSKYINLFTYDFVKNKLFNISDELLKKQWEKNQDYNTKKLDSFIGYELSLPEEIKSGKNTECDKAYNIYCIEYWNNTKCFVTFSICQENSTYKINSISYSNQAFTFKNKD